MTVLILLSFSVYVVEIHGTATRDHGAEWLQHRFQAHYGIFYTFY